MRKIVRYFYENKQKILITIGILAFIIFIIHFINNIMKENNKNNNQNNDINISKIEDVTVSNKATISNEKISNDKANQYAELIRNFVNNCNKKNYEEAYNFLSDDCKEVLYPDLKKFTDDYVDYIFKVEKIYNLELWQGNTYKIVYYENNLLATGGMSSNNNYIDYITIKRQNEDLKINISSFIEEKQLSINKTYNDINVKVNSKIVYIDYEIYNVSIINNRTSTICISNSRNTKDIILIDQNDNEHSSSIFEISMDDLIIEPSIESRFDIKFNITNQYNNEGKYIKFEKICINYDEYKGETSILEPETIEISVKV